MRWPARFGLPQVVGRAVSVRTVVFPMATIGGGERALLETPSNPILFAVFPIFFSVFGTLTSRNFPPHLQAFSLYLYFRNHTGLQDSFVCATGAVW